MALVGIDGSGKTTQGRRLADTLTGLGIPATYWQNAGGRRWFGRLARRLGRRDAQRLLGRDGMLLAESVLRWLAIARALARSRLTGRVAVMDRYAVCQYASIRTHGGGPRWERLARFAYRVFPPPDVTFLLAVTPDEAYRRIEARGTDHESLDYLSAGVAAYRSVPEFAGFVLVDANRPPDEVAAAILAGLREWLPPEHGPPEPDRRRGPAGYRAAHGPPAGEPWRPGPPGHGPPAHAPPGHGPSADAPPAGPSAQPTGAGGGQPEPEHPAPARDRSGEPGREAPLRPARRPERSRRSSARSPHWPESESPGRSRPAPPSGSDPRWAGPPDWPECR